MEAALDERLALTGRAHVGTPTGESTFQAGPKRSDAFGIYKKGLTGPARLLRGSRRSEWAAGKHRRSACCRSPKRSAAPIGSRCAGILETLAPEAMRGFAAVEAVMQESGELADLGSKTARRARAAIELASYLLQSGIARRRDKWAHSFCGPRCGCARCAARPICAGLSSHPPRGALRGRSVLA
jgi:hypothetical protein